MEIGIVNGKEIYVAHLAEDPSIRPGSERGVGGAGAAVDGYSQKNRISFILQLDTLEVVQVLVDTRWLIKYIQSHRFAME
jgi:hypothetical protein